jgi:predicted RNA-binding Zn ribbon-like protein
MLGGITDRPEPVTDGHAVVDRNRHRRSQHVTGIGLLIHYREADGVHGRHARRAVTMSTSPHSAIPTDPSEFECIDFVNSKYSDHLGSRRSTDRLASPEWMHWFLERFDLAPDKLHPVPLGELVSLRRDLRRSLEKWADDVPLNRRDLRLLDDRLREAPLRLRVAQTPSGPAVRQEPLERSCRWVMARLTASALALLHDGDPARLKVCGNPHCSWVFYDKSINRSRQFCSTTPCGTLVRVRRFRARS